MIMNKKDDVDYLSTFVTLRTIEMQIMIMSIRKRMMS